MASRTAQRPKTAAKPAKKRRKAPAKPAAAPSADQCSATTAKGARCRRKAAAGAELCPVHLGARVGRPAKLDEDAIVKMEQILAAGGYVETAAAVAGVSKSTFFAWLERGDPEGAKAENAPYRAFRARIERARAQGETRAVTLIATAASKDWKAAAWMLERQFPERWAGPLGRKHAQSGIGDPDDPPGAGADDLLDAPRVVDDQVGPDGRPL